MEHEPRGDRTVTSWGTGRRAMGAALSLMLILALLAACSGPSNGSTAATATAATAGGGATATSVASTAVSTATAASTPKSTTTAAATAAPTTPVASPSTPSANMTVSAYFIRGEKIAATHRQATSTQQVATAAMQELLKGPSTVEANAGMTTNIPQGTKLLDLAIANKVATVDLSSEFASGGGSASMTARLAQVVFTLTQFSTVEKVTFRLNGQTVTTFGGEGIVLDHPVGRSDYEQITPAILVESPTVGETVGSPVRLTGSANTFEAAFTINIVDASGKMIKEQHAQATSGSGTRGTFDVSVPFTIDATQAGKIVVFEASAKDGSKTNVVEIPVTLTK